MGVLSRQCYYSVSITSNMIYFYLLIFNKNFFFRYLCISSVYVLTTECSSLTVTLVITLRKFVSLLFSIVYFNNEFTIIHWIGTTLVFIGTIIFTDIKGMIKSYFTQKQKIK